MLCGAHNIVWAHKAHQCMWCAQARGAVVCAQLAAALEAAQEEFRELERRDTKVWGCHEGKVQRQQPFQHKGVLLDG
jgi:hypothetical protein